MFEVIFDIETKSFFDETGNSDPSRLGVSIVSVYIREVDDNFREISAQMTSFWESQLPDMWSLFRKADRIIGFNTLGFDIPVLKPYAPADFSKLPHFDIYPKIKEVNLGHAASLNRIAKDTLGQSKVDDPANAIKYWRAGDAKSLALLQKYCEADVSLTRDIYDFGLRHKHIKYTDRWNTPRVIPVDFSYPPDLISSQKQTSLF